MSASALKLNSDPQVAANVPDGWELVRLRRFDAPVKEVQPETKEAQTPATAHDVESARFFAQNALRTRTVRHIHGRRQLLPKQSVRDPSGKKVRRQGKRNKKNLGSSEVAVPALSPMMDRNLFDAMRSMARSALSPDHTYHFLLPQTLSLTSSGAGVFNGSIYGFDPSSAANWTELALIFDEFRCIRLDLQFVPRDRYNKQLEVAAAGFQTAPIAIGYDLNTASVTPGSYDAVLARTGSKLLSLDQGWTFPAVRPTTKDQTWWAPVAAPTTFPGSIIAYGDQNANTLNMGKTTGWYHVEFRMVQ
jgi:hypothetical protein